MTLSRDLELTTHRRELMRIQFRDYFGNSTGRIPKVPYQVQRLCQCECKDKNTSSTRKFDQKMIPIIKTFLGETTSELNKMVIGCNIVGTPPIKDRQNLTTVMQHMHKYHPKCVEEQFKLLQRDRPVQCK